MFWLLAALLTLGASLAVLLPLSGRDEAAGVAEGSHDLLVYRDQLAELERDVGRGAIAPDAAAEARIEIERRILRADGERGAAPRSKPSRVSRLGAAVAVLAVPVVSWGLYGFIGAPDLPSQPLSARLEKDPAQSTVEELVTRAEAHLAADPNDGRGWSVIAPIYLRLGRFDDAAAAYRSAMRVLGATADRENGLGEALAGAAGGAVSDDARAAFERALRLDPGNPLARFQLAAAQAQGGHVGEAVAGWNALLADLPPDSPWRGAVARAVAEAGGASGPVAGGGTEAGGPTAEQVAAAQAMPDSDRAGMIEGMVEKLDQKLRDDPHDPQGWMRLVRSYLVLNKPDRARDALSRGRAALDGASDDGRRLEAFAASLGLAETAEP